MRVISEPDSGIYNAMNKAIVAARGSHLLFLNAGTISPAPTRSLWTHDDWVREGYDGVDIGRGSWTVSAARPGRWPLRGWTSTPSAAVSRALPPGAIMSRRMLLDLGGFDERYRIVADFDLMRRALIAGYRPWCSDRIITDYDASGLSAVAWRQSLREEHEVRASGGDPVARAASWTVLARRTALIAARRTLRQGAEATLGVARVSELRGADLAGRR